MATISYQHADVDGNVVTFAAASGGGDKIQARAHGCLLVRNGDASAHVVTVVVPGNDQYGSARPDVTKSVPAGQTFAFGPFPGDLEDSDDDMIDITYDGVTSVTVAALAL